MTETERSRATLSRRDTVAYRLGGALILLVIGFDLLSVLAPGVMGAPLLRGGVAGAGVFLAVFIVLAVIVTAVLFVRGLNREDAANGTSRHTRPDR